DRAGTLAGGIEDLTAIETRVEPGDIRGWKRKAFLRARAVNLRIGHHRSADSRSDRCRRTGRQRGSSSGGSKSGKKDTAVQPPGFSCVSQAPLLVTGTAGIPPERRGSTYNESTILAQLLLKA